jgi:O-antigen/teichoic acid export membrane protein
MTLRSLYDKARNHIGFKKYAMNTSWILIGKFSTMAISFIATLYIARDLGPTNFGELSYAVSFTGLFSFIAAFGIDAVLYRDLIKYPELRARLIGTALVIKFCTGIIAAFAAIASAILFSPKDVSFILVFILSASFFFTAFNIITSEFGAIVRNKGISIISIGVTLILNIAKIVTIILGGGVIYLALILLAEAVLSALAYMTLHRITFGSVSELSFDKGLAKSLIYDAWPFILSSACAVIYTRIDQVMLKNIIDSTAVGLYDSAVRLTEVWYFIPAVLAGSLFPALVLSRLHSLDNYKKRSIALFGLVTVIATIICLFIYFLSSPIIRIVYGEDFLGAVPILRIYIWALLPVFVISIANQILLTENARSILFVSALLGMITNVLGNSLLIPVYETSGAAFSTILSSFTVLFFLVGVYYYKKRVHKAIDRV